MQQQDPDETAAEQGGSDVAALTESRQRTMSWSTTRRAARKHIDTYDSILLPDSLFSYRSPGIRSDIISLPVLGRTAMQGRRSYVFFWVRTHPLFEMNCLLLRLHPT